MSNDSPSSACQFHSERRYSGESQSYLDHGQLSGFVPSNDRNEGRSKQRMKRQDIRRRDHRWITRRLSSFLHWSSKVYLATALQPNWLNRAVRSTSNAPNAPCHRRLCLVERIKPWSGHIDWMLLSNGCWIVLVISCVYVLEIRPNRTWMDSRLCTWVIDAEHAMSPGFSKNREPVWPSLPRAHPVLCH